MCIYSYMYIYIWLIRLKIITPGNKYILYLFTKFWSLTFQVYIYIVIFHICLSLF